MPEKKTFKDFIKGWKDKESIKDKIKRGFRKGKEAIVSTVRWVKDNPQEAAIYASIIAGLTGFLKKGLRHVNLKQEQYNKERYVYDFSNRCYLKTKRKLNSKDVSNINRLRRENPKLKMSEALERLNLLK